MILSGDVVWENGVTRIRKEGKFHKFNARLEQVSYNGSDAQELGQEAWYVTERAVFTRGPEGIELVEIAPGVDLDRDPGMLFPDREEKHVRVQRSITARELWGLYPKLEYRRFPSNMPPQRTGNRL